MSFEALLGARCVRDAERRRPYEIPERGAPGHTPAVLLPETADEVAQILRSAQRTRSPLVLSAGRTGLVEAQRPQGETVLSLERLKRIHGYDAATQTVEVDAAVSIDALNEYLAPHGRLLPLEMGSSSAATVGACVANASAGANAVCYGTAAHMCVTAQGLWADGTPAQSQGPRWQPVAPQQLAINSAAPNPAWGLIGTQGVLGVITRLSLRTQPIPAQREAALLPMADMPRAMRLLTLAQRRFPGAVEEFEFISRAALRRVQQFLGERFRSPVAHHDAAYFLLLQVKADTADEDLAAQLYDFLSTDCGLDDAQIGYAPLPALKKIRHSITEASNARLRETGGGRLSLDTATPVAVFGHYLARLDAEIARDWPAVEFLAFGHAGVGGAHLHALGTQDAALTQRIFDITAAFGGTFSAEHGVGAKWGAEYQRRVRAAERAALRAEKLRRDPAGILSPRSFGMDLQG